MITVTNISKAYGGQSLYEEASFFISPGEKVGLVGPNGAGKTSLFRLIIKEERPDKGSIQIPDKFRVAYFSQSVGDMKGQSILSEVMSGDEKVAVIKTRLQQIEKKLEDPDCNPDEMEKILIEMGELQTEFEQRGGYDLEFRAQEILTGLGFDPKLHSSQVETFSGGWKMRVALAKVLVQNPDAVLMDEPTNYLDLESIIWLESWLKTFKGAVFMTSHDRDFLNGLVKKIVEVRQGKITVFSGNYDYYEKERAIRTEQLKSSFESQQAMLAKEEEFIAKFAARASHAAQVQSRVKKLDKIDKIELPPEERVIDFAFPNAPRSGNEVVVFKDLAKIYQLPDGSPKKVFENVSGLVKRLDKLAVVGVNGAGKSTLLKIVGNLTEASRGNATVGASVSMGYFSQYSLDVLNPKNTVFEEVRSRVKDNSDGYIRNLLGAFLFRGDDIDKKISVLSGGEKSRLILATILTANHNFLLLDEPTNHLDIRSREVLLDALKNFEGTLMIVSHDRHFLRSLSNRVLQVSQGGVQFYDGTYDYYLEKTSI